MQRTSSRSSISPVKIPHEAAKALQESITSLLGKRPSPDGEENGGVGAAEGGAAGGGGAGEGGRKGKKARPQRPKVRRFLLLDAATILMGPFLVFSPNRDSLPIC